MGTESFLVVSGVVLGVIGFATVVRYYHKNYRRVAGGSMLVALGLGFEASVDLHNNGRDAIGFLVLAIIALAYAAMLATFILQGYNSLEDIGTA